jgi:two-component sensor histidine kinase
VQVKKYIETLVQNIQSFIVSSNQPKIKILCEDILLNIDQTIPLGLIINELITNSFKHAFVGLDNSINIITISIIENNKKIKLHYQDNGIGIKEKKGETKNSVGLKLLKMLVQELQGKHEIRSNQGFEFEMSFVNNEIKKQTR